MRLRVLRFTKRSSMSLGSKGKSGIRGCTWTHIWVILLYSAVMDGFQDHMDLASDRNAMIYQLGPRCVTWHHIDICTTNSLPQIILVPPMSPFNVTDSWKVSHCQPSTGPRNHSRTPAPSNRYSPVGCRTRISCGMARWRQKDSGFRCRALPRRNGTQCEPHPQILIQHESAGMLFFFMQLPISFLSGICIDKGWRPYTSSNKSK